MEVGFQSRRLKKHAIATAGTQQQANDGVSVPLVLLVEGGSLSAMARHQSAQAALFFTQPVIPHPRLPYDYVGTFS